MLIRSKINLIIIGKVKSVILMNIKLVLEILNFYHRDIKIIKLIIPCKDCF